MTDEELQEIADTYGLYTEQDVENRVSCELLRIGARNEDLEKENAELKEVLESDKRSLRLIAEKGADLEKENAELKAQIEKMKCCQNCKFDDFMEEPCCNCSRCFGDIKREGYSDKWEIN